MPVWRAKKEGVFVTGSLRSQKLNMTEGPVLGKMILFTIPVKDGKKVYADFHKSVKDYSLPFAADAKTVIMESSSGVSLKGNKVSVSGSYGYIVVKVKQ